SALQEGIQCISGILDGRWLWPEIQRPVGIDPGCAIPPLEQMSGRKLLDSLDQGMWAGYVVQRQVITEAGNIERAWNLGMDEQSLQLGAEVDFRAPAMQVERLDSEPIPAQYQAFGGLTPESQGEHSAKPGETVHIPLEKGLKSDFRIATRLEPMTQGFQFGPQLGVIIDLTVENGDRIAILAS